MLHENVGLNDNFFALGGHSLAAVKVVSMIREEFGIEIGVRTLFDKPTVGGLAGVLEDAIREELGLLNSGLVTPDQMTTEPIEGQWA